MSYSKLGQSEDPPFTFKAMVVQTNWPGASAEEVARQVTERIEKKLMETGDYDRIVSFSRPGVSQVTFMAREDIHSSEIPELWYQIRKKISAFAPPCRKASRARSSTTSSAPPTATSMRSPARASTMR